MIPQLFYSLSNHGGCISNCRNLNISGLADKILNSRIKRLCLPSGLGQKRQF